MFKDRFLQVKMVKDPVEPSTDDRPKVDPAVQAMVLSKHAIKIYAAFKGIDLACRMVEHVVVTRIR